MSLGDIKERLREGKWQNDPLEATLLMDDIDYTAYVRRVLKKIAPKKLNEKIKSVDEKLISLGLEIAKSGDEEMTDYFIKSFEELIPDVKKIKPHHHLREKQAETSTKS